MCFSLYEWYPPTRNGAEWSQVMVTMMTFIVASNEEDLLTHEVSDEALEAAGGNEETNFTMAACTFHVGCAG